MKKVSTSTLVGFAAWHEAGNASSKVSKLQAELKSQSEDMKRSMQQAMESHSAELARLQNSLQNAEEASQRQATLREKVFLVRNSLKKVLGNDDLEDGEKFYFTENIAEPISSLNTSDFDAIQDKEYFHETQEIAANFLSQFKQSHPDEAWMFRSLEKNSLIQSISQNYLHQSELCRLASRAQTMIEKQDRKTLRNRRLMMSGISLFCLFMLFNVGSVSSFFGVLIFSAILLVIGHHGGKALLEPYGEEMAGKLAKIIARYNRDSGSPLEHDFVSSTNFARIRNFAYDERDISAERLEELGVDPQIEEEQLAAVMNDAAESTRYIVAEINSRYKNLQLAFEEPWSYAPGAADKALKKMAELESAPTPLPYGPKSEA